MVETASALLEELGLSSGTPKGTHRMETGGQSGLPHGLMLTPSPPATVSKAQERVAQPQPRTASHTPLWGHGKTRSSIEGGHHDTPKLHAVRASLKRKPGAIKHDCSGPQ